MANVYLRKVGSVDCGSVEWGASWPRGPVAVWASISKIKLRNFVRVSQWRRVLLEMVAHLKIGNILSQALSSAGLSPPSTLYKQWKAEEQGKRKSKSCASVFKAPFVDNLSNLITSGSTAYSYGRTVRKANQFGTTGETSSWTAPAADALVDSQLLGDV